MGETKGRKTEGLLIMSAWEGGSGVVERTGREFFLEERSLSLVYQKKRGTGLSGFGGRKLKEFLLISFLFSKRTLVLFHILFLLTRKNIWLKSSENTSRGF